MNPKRFYMDKRTYEVLERQRQSIRVKTGIKISQTQFSKRFILPKLLRGKK